MIQEQKKMQDMQKHIEFYQQEIRIKESKLRQEEQKNGDLDLDNLIEVS